MPNRLKKAEYGTCVSFIFLKGKSEILSFATSDPPGFLFLSKHRYTLLPVKDSGCLPTGISCMEKYSN